MKTMVPNPPPAPDLDKLALILKSIDTQYDLARMELFRPLEGLDRFQGIRKPACGCHPTYTSKRVGYDVAPPPGTMDGLVARMDHVRSLIEESSKECGAVYATDLLDNIATCPHDRASVLSVKVSITWHGRTLVREYVLPEVP